MLGTYLGHVFVLGTAWLSLAFVCVYVFEEDSFGKDNIFAHIKPE